MMSGIGIVITTIVNKTDMFDDRKEERERDHYANGRRYSNFSSVVPDDKKERVMHHPSIFMRHRCIVRRTSHTETVRQRVSL